jgi:hypothetical protein
MMRPATSFGRAAVPALSRCSGCTTYTTNTARLVDQDWWRPATATPEVGQLDARVATAQATRRRPRRVAGVALEADRRSRFQTLNPTTMGVTIMET